MSDVLMLTEAALLLQLHWLAWGGDREVEGWLHELAVVEYIPLAKTLCGSIKRYRLQ